MASKTKWHTLCSYSAGKDYKIYNYLLQARLNLCNGDIEFKSIDLKTNGSRDEFDTDLDFKTEFKKLLSSLKC